MHKLLRERGLLFLEVPNAFAITGVYRWVLAPSANHLYIYTVSTLSQLLRKCGFGVLKIYKCGLNIRVVAQKSLAVHLAQEKIKCFYRRFLLVNRLNKILFKMLVYSGLYNKIVRMGQV